MSSEASREAWETGGIHAQTPPSLILILGATLREAELLSPGPERTLRPRGRGTQAAEAVLTVNPELSRVGAGDLRGGGGVGRVPTTPAVRILRTRQQRYVGAPAPTQEMPVVHTFPASGWAGRLPALGVSWNLLCPEVCSGGGRGQMQGRFGRGVADPQLLSKVTRRFLTRSPKCPKTSLHSLSLPATSPRATITITPLASGCLCEAGRWAWGGRL